MSMKILFLAISLLITINIVAQQRPQKVLSFVDVTWKSKDYQKLEKEWKVFVDKDNTDANAWENYYNAAMYKYRASAYYRDSVILGSLKEMQAIIDQMAKAIPESFEYNRLVYRNSNMDLKYAKNIEKAHNLRPNNIDLYPIMLTYYGTIGAKKKLKELFKKWYDTDPSIELYKLSYGYNTLVGVEKNAIILASGDNQYYPVGLVQYGKGFRPDVSIMAISMFWNDDYYNSTLKELGISEFDKNYKYYYKLNKKAAWKAQNQLVNERIKHIIDNIGDRPIYFPLRMSNSTRSYFDDSLYMIGTLNKYSSETFDNIAILRKNFEQKYLLDEVKVSLKQNNDNSSKPRILSLYIMPLVELYKHYLSSGELAKADNAKRSIMNLATNLGRKQKYIEYLNEIEDKLSNQ